MKFLDRHNILYTHQYGFRPKYSIDYAVMSLQNYIIKEFEKGNYTIGIFLDLSKAFDTLDKNLLLNKLHSYGIRGIPNKWINSYLSDRNQQVQLRNILSDKNFIDTGVPQGSVLGPVMFLLYVNDLPNFDNKVFTLMFADDSSLFISGPNLDELMHRTKNIIIKVQNWINTNKLSLNLKKTKFMIFSTRDIKEHDYINVRNFKIERVRFFKFLGFFIQENLKWTHHVNYILGMVSKGIGALRKVRKVLNQDALLTMYYSFIYPYIQRGAGIWANTCKRYMLDILLKQKQAVRIIAGARYLDHTVPLFKELNILPIDLLYKQQLLILMYNTFHKKMSRTHS